MSELRVRPTGTRRVRPDGPNAVRPMPAGRVLVVVVVALLTAGLLNGEAMAAATDRMPSGLTRSLLRPVAHAFDTVGHAFRVDALRHRLDSALGRHAEGGGGAGLLQAADGAKVAPVGTTPVVGATGPTSPSPVPVVAPVALRDASLSDPLKLLITGDSMIEFMAGKLINAADDHGALKADTPDVKYGTGLVRPDFFDWLAHARTLMTDHDPEAVVVMMGGNDGQNIQLPDGPILTLATPEWTAEYQRRAAAVMAAFAGDGHRRVYWVGMPIARSPRLANGYHALDSALAAAATTVPGVSYISSWELFANSSGKYADYLPDSSGKPVLVRAKDGIHVSRDGAAWLAKRILVTLEADWKLNS